MRADIMPQPLDFLAVLQQVLVDIAAEDDLLLGQDGRIEINRQLPRALGPAGQLHAKLQPLAQGRLEIRRIAPKPVALEIPRVMQ